MLLERMLQVCETEGTFMSVIWGIAEKRSTREVDLCCIVITVIMGEHHWYSSKGMRAYIQHSPFNAPFEISFSVTVEKLGRFPGLFRLSLVVPPRLTNALLDLPFPRKRKPSTHSPKNTLVYFQP